MIPDDAPVPMTSRRADPRSLKLLEVNARFMPKETYDRLVANIRRDGACSQSVLVYAPEDVDPVPEPVVLSGNHRVQASIEAEVFDVPTEWIDREISRARQIALQLSHNAISGEDDPATLRALYDQLDVEMRDYSGLDDRDLGLLDDPDLAGLSEANLEFATVALVFLPSELERARELLGEARKLISPQVMWTARLEQYEQVLDTLQTAHSAWNVGNVATALSLVLNVFESALTGEVQEAWFDPAEALPKRGGEAPLETLFGSRVIRTDAGAVVARALRKAVASGDCEQGQEVRMLELWAAEYLAGN